MPNRICSYCQMPEQDHYTETNWRIVGGQVTSDMDFRECPEFIARVKSGLDPLPEHWTELTQLQDDQIPF